MLKPLCHDPAGSIAQDAGLLGLEHEIRATPTDQLAEMASLLIELPPALADAARPRLRRTLWELRRRTVRAEVAA